MTRHISRLSILLVLILGSNNIYAQQKGDVIYRAGFDSKAEMTGWDGRYRLVKKDGNGAMRVNSNNKLFFDLPVDKARGATVAVKARLKAKNVSTPPNPWNGIKVMLHSILPWTDEYPQMSLPAGTFDWREVSFTTHISPSVDTIRLVLGLENVKGRIWFDYVEVSIYEPAQILPQAKSTMAIYTGHGQDRLRGMMVNTFISAAELQTLAGWGVNHIRWQLSWHGFPSPYADTAGIASYTNWLNETLPHIDSLLPLCRELGIKVLLDLHTPPGGRAEGYDHRIFREKEWQQALRDTWKMIAARYKDEPAIWGYDLVNEPIEGIVPPGLMNWNELAAVTAQDIRAIDTTHAIIIEASPAGSPEGLEHFRPVPVPGVIYSFHMYHPYVFTHQGLNNAADNIRYPGIIMGKEWNKETIRKVLQPLRNWQNAYGVHLYVGEFSAIRWAPGESAYYYLRDCIEVFEEFGWDWAYHAFREFDGWSIEHGTRKDDPVPSATPTLRMQLMQEWFEKNKISTKP